jgi:hypothetical protein
MAEKLRHHQSAKEFFETQKKKNGVNNKINSKLFEQPGDLRLEVHPNTRNMQSSSAI